MTNISFDNTETAFAYKTSGELKKAKFVFASMGKPWLVKLGLQLTPWALKIGLPVKGLIRQTIFTQFVGGETLKETSGVADKLGEFNVHVILDYGVEGKEGEENFDKARDVFINAIRYAATQTNIPFMSVKLTGYARFSLLQKLQEASVYIDIIQGMVPLEKLTEHEKEEWQRVVGRLETICESAKNNGVGVLIDAEETWIQDPVDALSIQMMRKFNMETAVVYNTAQLYRNDRLQFIKDSSRFAKENNFKLGMKIVRGAYLEKERRRATELNYPSPINENKQLTDDEFNAAIEFCVDPSHDVHIILGSHNEYSNLYATEVMKKFGLPLHDKHVHFSQLYGMSDHITFNLAKAGCLVSKYLPFGPIKDVIPYLMRRAQENAAVSGQTGRELGLIKKELKRRLRK
ncbi:MAG: proline dehydrogenase family protein [Ginsengibacter sp.]